MRLVDSHGHVNADRFADDVDLVLGAARLAGVERILVPGWNHASSERALALDPYVRAEMVNAVAGPQVGHAGFTMNAQDFLCGRAR